MVLNQFQKSYSDVSGIQPIHERVNKMSKKISVKFQLLVEENEVINFEYFLQDLLQSSVLPALSAELVPLTLEVKKARN